MGTSAQAELHHLRLLVPHYWKVGLALIGLGATVVGLLTGSALGIGGAVLLLGGVASTLSDVRQVRRRLDSLYAVPSATDLAAVQLAGGYVDWRRIESPRGAAIIHPEVSRWLWTAADVPVEVETTDYRPPREVAWARDLALVSARRRGQRETDDPKVRLRTDLLPPELPTSVLVQRTRFSYARITNDLVATEIRSKEPGRVRLVAESVALPGGRLPTLRASRCSDHVGVSALALTRAGELVLNVQSHANSQSAGLLAPSGSGSADWGDLEVSRVRGEGFLGFVREAMARELAEECGLREDQVGETTILGFARLLHRGGKPEFFGFTRLAATAEELRRTRAERRFVEGYQTEPIDLTDVATAIASLGEFVAREGPRLSVPLLVAVELLMTWLDEDPAAIDDLRSSAPDALFG